MQLPPPLRDAIERETSRFNLKQLAEAATELSENYRHRQQSGEKRISNDAERMAYLAVRMPATLAAAGAVFTEMRRLMPEAGVASLLDLGAGPGTSAWAAVNVFDRIKQITLLEQDQDLIQLGKSLAENSDNRSLLAANWQKVDLKRASEFPPHDLVVCSYSLGEIERGAAVKILQTAWKSTRQAIAIIEPGTVEGFDLIRTLREELIRLGGHLAAPCPHTQTCPMRDNDWCHFAVRFERTTLHRRIKLGLLGYEDEKFAYITASKYPVQRVNSRVIRHPQSRSGHIQLQLCTQDQLQTVTITRSDKETWKQARKTEWGDEWS